MGFSTFFPQVIHIFIHSHPESLALSRRPDQKFSGCGAFHACRTISAPVNWLFLHPEDWF